MVLLFSHVVIFLMVAHSFSPVLRRLPTILGHPWVIFRHQEVQAN